MKGAALVALIATVLGPYVVVQQVRAQAGGGTPATIVVTHRGDEGLQPGATACDTGAESETTRCTLRAALELLAVTGGSGTVELPPGLIVRQRSDPYPLRGSVKVVGAGSTATVIDGDHRGSLFASQPGARLELRELSVVSNRTPVSERNAMPSEELLLRDVLVADELAMVGDDPSAELFRSCVSGRSLRIQYFSDVQVSDPTAIRSIPGEMF